MNRFGIFAGSAVVLALAVAGCAQTPPYATATPSALATSASPVVSVTPSASPTSATPSASPTATGLVLAGTGVAGLPFGTAQAVVAKKLTAAVGKADSSTQGQTCTLNSSSPWGETVVYGNLWVQFTAKNTKKASPRTLTGWGYQLGNTLPKPWAVADNVPLNLTFNQLKAKYPAAKYLNLGLPDKTKALQLPNKMIFVGIGKPEAVRAGELSVCE